MTEQLINVKNYVDGDRFNNRRICVTLEAKILRQDIFNKPIITAHENFTYVGYTNSLDNGIAVSLSSRNKSSVKLSFGSISVVQSLSLIHI